MMEGFTPLEINLDGDNAWPELREIAFASGMATHVAVLSGGMTTKETPESGGLIIQIGYLTVGRVR